MVFGKHYKKRRFREKFREENNKIAFSVVYGQEDIDDEG